MFSPGLLARRASDMISRVLDPRLEVKKDPVLIVDLYWNDLPHTPKWSVLANTPNYVGAILKATEGSYYSHSDWFTTNWGRLRSAGGDRYGQSWFRGAYHYLRFDVDGVKQADYFMRVVDRAGGWSHGDVMPIVDVERGGEHGPNYDDDAKEVTACTSRFIERVREVTGRPVMLYGRGAMRDLNIKSTMGARYLWNPSYTATMPRRSVTKIGWDLLDVAMWQYTDGKVSRAKTKSGVVLPRVVPGFGAVDASVFLLGGVDEFRRRLVVT